MREPRFLCSTPDSADAVARPEVGERVMWRGRVGLAEYAFEQASSLPFWTLPESTQVLVTDRRVVWANNPERPDRATGEVRWLWPQHLSLQPGARSPDRGSMASQVQLICAAADGSYPAVVFAGGDLKTVGDADKLANALRLAVARYRVDHAERLGIAEHQTRVLSRLLIGPEFSSRPGGQGQTVSLAGGQFVPDPAAAPAAPPASAPPGSASGGGAGGQARPGVEADAERARRAAQAEEVHQQRRPDLASRASEIAARVADLVARSSEVEAATQRRPGDRHDEEAADDDWAADEPTLDQTERAERLRRSAARFTSNSARGRAAAPAWDPDDARRVNRNN